MKSGLVERVNLKVDGLQIVAEVYFPEGQGPHPALCICHGVPARAPAPPDRGYPLLAERFCSQGFVVLIFNFRGTGESEGNFDILDWTRDLEAAISYLCRLDEVDKSQLSVMGFSGGAAVSVYQSAKDNRISSVVTCACPAWFSAIGEFNRIVAFLEQSRLVGIIRNSDFPPSVEEWARGFEQINPIKWVRKISPRPLLILHGDSDQVVEPGQAWELYREAKRPKDISIIRGGEHKLRLSEPAMSTALFWLKRVNSMAVG